MSKCHVLINLTCLECCSTIESSNSIYGTILYTFNGRVENGKPVYENRNTGRAFWFVSFPGLITNWINGKLSDLDEGKKYNGYYYGLNGRNGNTQCPNNVSRWSENYNGRVNNDVTVDCVSNENGIY